MKKRVVLLTVALLLVGGIAYASIPGPDGVIKGCYKTNNPNKGALIAIDSAANCPTGYTLLTWSQTGPQGPAGPQGASGPPGVAGPPGPAGISGHEVVVHTEDVGENPNQLATIAAMCPAGKNVLGGGIHMQHTTPFDIKASRPIEDQTPGDFVGWNVEVALPATFEGTHPVTAYAICATVAA